MRAISLRNLGWMILMTLMSLMPLTPLTPLTRLMGSVASAALPAVLDSAPRPWDQRRVSRRA
jgi:hypothetical protein